MLVGVVRELMFESLHHHRATPQETAVFANQKHNDDLCPRAQHQCDALLRSVKRQKSIAYDIQGPFDFGSDVVVVVKSEDQAQFIGIQIKSDPEAKGGVYETIKAQYVDTVNRYGGNLLDYYVLLCWNESTRQPQIRKVASDWVSSDVVRVIEPGYALSFLNMQPRTFDAILRRCLGDSDPLIENARRLATDTPFTRTRLLFQLIAELVGGSTAVSTSKLMGNPGLRQVYETAVALGADESFRFAPSLIIPDDLKLAPSATSVDEAISNDIEVMDEYLAIEEETVRLDLVGIEPLIALAFEANARSGYVHDELVEYLSDLLLPSATTDRSRRDAISLAVNTMIDVVRGDGPSVGLLLEANFSSLNEARSVLLPPAAYKKYPTADTDDLTWELLGEAVAAEVFDYESLNDLWEDRTWPEVEPPEN